jgi:hypothetical protein
MTKEPSWLHLAKELREIKQSAEPLRAEWYAYEGSEDYGIWLLRPEGLQTDEVHATFSLFAARAIQKLGIPPIPVPQPCQHFPDWVLYCRILEEMAGRNRKPIDLSDAVPYGLGVVDRDAVDPCTRGWLEWLRRYSAAFRSSEGELSLRGQTYKSFSGSIQDLCGASAASCTRLARDEIGARRIERLAPKVKKRRVPGAPVREQARDRAARRQAVVDPILEQKHWKPGRLVTKSGVGKATVYGYLNGTRSWIDKANRKAIAEALGLKLEQLPL